MTPPNYKSYAELMGGDTIKPLAKDTIKNLNDCGKTLLLSGDNHNKVKEVAIELGINDFKSELLPNEKTEELEKIISQENRSVVYVGDGVNDAPSIKLADVGIAMGGIGSAKAVASADVVIMNDRVENLTKINIVARRTKKIVAQNIILSIALKFAIVIVSMVFTVPIYFAVIGDVGVMLLAVLNSIRNSK